MKKLYFLLIGICFFNVVNAQIINFPDAKFKFWLLSTNISSPIAKDINGNNISIDINRNNEIEVNEALNVYKLDVSYTVYSTNIITSLVGIEYFTNLKILNCGFDNINSLDVSALSNLEELYAFYTNLSNLNINGLKKIKYLDIKDNSISSIDVSNLHQLEVLKFARNRVSKIDLSGLSNLKELDCSSNQLMTLDVTENSNLADLDCSSNNFISLDFSGNKNLGRIKCACYTLTSLFIKNGKIDVYNCNFAGANLNYVCCDEEVAYLIKLYFPNIKNINSYCSFVPGAAYYTIQGNTKLDTNNNGYDNSDDIYPNLNLSITDGIIKGNFISDSSGNYSIPVQAGAHTITPNIENPNYFTVSPSSVNVTFPTQTSPFVQNFCISPKGVHNDLEVTILPTIPARPGFDATYKIIYKNKGTTTQSGSVSLSFNDAVLDYISAIPAITNQVADKLSWDYVNLQPFESREISVTLNVNSPMETPAVNIGDRLSFNALINPVTGDEKPVDNSSALRQSVVGSFDPNDKTCLEGDIITPSLIGEYVNYLIRFENTGTYLAQNIVVKDLIDLSKFDISTLIPTKASHDFVTKISNGNKVEFIFENINLPFDNATNDGYIAFKIKTLPTLVVGDSFENEANIFFDYNFPVLTNKVKSTFKSLGTPDFEFADYFSLYPNPANAILNIETKNSIEVESIVIYDILGQIIIAIPNAKTVSNIDVSKLTSGNYFLKMNTNKGTSNVKFIKK